MMCVCVGGPLDGREFGPLETEHRAIRYGLHVYRPSGQQDEHGRRQWAVETFASAYLAKRGRHQQMTNR